MHLKAVRNLQRLNIKSHGHVRSRNEKLLVPYSLRMNVDWFNQSPDRGNTAIGNKLTAAVYVAIISMIESFFLFGLKTAVSPSPWLQKFSGNLITISIDGLNYGVVSCHLK
jgi:hypothetical protein